MNVNRALAILVTLVLAFFCFIGFLDSGPGNGLVISVLIYLFSIFTVPLTLISVGVCWCVGKEVKVGLLIGLLSGIAVTALTVSQAFMH